MVLISEINRLLSYKHYYSFFFKNVVVLKLFKSFNFNKYLDFSSYVKFCKFFLNNGFFVNKHIFKVFVLGNFLNKDALMHRFVRSNFYFVNSFFKVNFYYFFLKCFFLFNKDFVNNEYSFVNKDNKVVFDALAIPLVVKINNFFEFFFKRDVNLFKNFDSSFVFSRFNRFFFSGVNSLKNYLFLKLFYKKFLHMLFFICLV